MTRLLSFALLAAGVVSASAARADLPVAPPPREVRPDGSRDPVPTPDAVKKENPLEVVERIIKNSKDVGDKLAMTDTGTETRKTQNTILKDIDKLLEQDPPPKSDMNDKKDDEQDMNPDMNDKKDDKKDNKSDMNDKKDMKDPGDKKDMNDKKDKKDTMPNGGMGDKKMDMMPMGGGMDEQPMGGDQPKERRPRQGGDKKEPAQPKEKDGKGGGNAEEKKEPMGGMPKPPPKNPGDGKMPDPKGGKPMPNPMLPFEDDVVKDVWGHLPDKLRQQATQYYKQEFMPRYSELLKLYYSSLSEKK